MLKQKKKLLAWCDSPTVPTGFGNVAKNLLDKASKDYDVAILGINENGLKKYDTDKWFIYPTTKEDVLGSKRLPNILNDFQPDLIFLFQDIYHVERAVQTIKVTYSTDIPIVVYFPVDATPFYPGWVSIFNDTQVKVSMGNRSANPSIDQPNVNKIFTYSKFANEAILDSIPNLDPKRLDILYHGVNTDVFKLLPEDVIKETEKRMHWEDKFIMMNINRFQPRKQIGISLLIGSLFTYGYHKCKCGNYYSVNKKKCTLNGCGSKDILETVSAKPDVGLYLHMNRREKIMGPPPTSDALETYAIQAGYPHDAPNKNIFLIRQNLASMPFEEDKLAELYNAASVNITTSAGEGCGLNLLESSACGTTSIAPNNSAIPEQIGDTGHLVKNIAHFGLPSDSGHYRPMVSIPGFIDALEIEYKKWVDNGRKKVVNHDAIARIQKKFLWEDKRKKLMKAFYELCPPDKA